METKTMKHGKYYVCRRLRMLDWLIAKGYEPISTISDTNNWRYKNWVFENSYELEQDIILYFQTLKEEKN